MLGEFGHEGLAEAHDFAVALALRVEVGAALAAAHREGGEGVLEALFEAEEFDNRRVDRRVESETALVRTDRGVELDAEAAVDLDFALVVDPGDSELDEALRLDYTVEDACLDEVGTLVGDRFEGLEDFAYSLLEFGLVRVSLADGLIDRGKVFVLEIHFAFPFLFVPLRFGRGCILLSHEDEPTWSVPFRVVIHDKNIILYFRLFCKRRNQIIHG